MHRRIRGNLRSADSTTRTRWQSKLGGFGNPYSAATQTWRNWQFVLGANPILAARFCNLYLADLATRTWRHSIQARRIAICTWWQSQLGGFLNLYLVRIRTRRQSKLRGNPNSRDSATRTCRQSWISQIRPIETSSYQIQHKITLTYQLYMYIQCKMSSLVHINVLAAKLKPFGVGFCNLFSADWATCSRRQSKLGGFAVAIVCLSLWRMLEWMENARWIVLKASVMWAI